jgi:hypothetical protein
MPAMNMSKLKPRLYAHVVKRVRWITDYLSIELLNLAVSNAPAAKANAPHVNSLHL